MQNQYRILGVPYDASLSQIRQAYRTLQLANHPDKTQHLPPAERQKREDFSKQVNSAWETLSEPSTRKKHDVTLNIHIHKPSTVDSVPPRSDPQSTPRSKPQSTPRSKPQSKSHFNSNFNPQSSPQPKPGPNPQSTPQPNPQPTREEKVRQRRKMKRGEPVTHRTSARAIRSGWAFCLDISA
jgi:curved DNA-binding protein CbpA